MQRLPNTQNYILFIVLTSLIGLFLNFVNTGFDETGHAAAWDDVRHQLSFDNEVHSKAVRVEINKWLADPDRLNHILKSATPYLDFIYQQTQKKDLPAELVLIPMIESEYNPNDHSRKGAVGLWQLMPKTAHELGVTTRGHDERRNVATSTQAALAYFKDLGQLFHGNWLLAIAAYNCGQAKVMHALARAGTDNFWALHLPLETRLYVPRLLALAEIIKHPQKYGVHLP